MLKAENRSVLPIVLAGGQGWLMDHFDTFLHGLELGRDVVLPGYVSDEELKWLYRNCFGFVYPSLFEGFGMPVLEALGFEAPVLCSYNSSLPEVAGEAALLFDPLDAVSMAAAMRRLASRDFSRNALKTAGKRQAAKFSWAQSASRLRDLYDQVMTLPQSDVSYEGYIRSSAACGSGL
jgi:glycosyltransferase involved in cell wall biosynthesis